MKTRSSVLIALALFVAVSLNLSKTALAEETRECPPDKVLCATMLRFGKEAYQRGRYLDAKEYFRKAVKADPTSLTAWRYYDTAVIFALAEKVEKSADMVMPDVSTREEAVTGPAPEARPAPRPPAAPPAAKEAPSGFKIVDDEGC